MPAAAIQATRRHHRPNTSSTERRRKPRAIDCMQNAAAATSPSSSQRRRPRLRRQHLLSRGREPWRGRWEDDVLVCPQHASASASAPATRPRAVAPRARATAPCRLRVRRTFTYVLAQMATPPIGARRARRRGIPVARDRGEARGAGRETRPGQAAQADTTDWGRGSRRPRRRMRARPGKGRAGGHTPAWS